MLKFTQTIHALFLGTSLFVLSAFLTPILAETITHKIDALNLTAQAEYSKGDDNKPAVLIIHGFLTTHNFHTITSFSQGLKEEGYTVLTPTLTLGINLRKQSLKCNAVHTHTLEDDMTEVESWVKWLETQGKKEVVVVGHSSGSHPILSMLQQKAVPNVKLAIFTSLFFLSGDELGTLPSALAQAKHALADNDQTPYKYSFLFCENNYYATAKSFLSYHKLTRPHVLNELKSLTIPHYTIMGESDKRYPKVGGDWLSQLHQTGTKLIVIKGANHFFSSEHEFELQEQLVDIIKRNMS